MSARMADKMKGHEAGLRRRRRLGGLNQPHGIFGEFLARPSRARLG
jgi:hypothetical protein